MMYFTKFISKYFFNSYKTEHNLKNLIKNQTWTNNCNDD